MKENHFDVLIVGAGISGIGAGVHLSRKCPNRSFAILEGRENIGGTWDLFKYPGIRSDSDMHTMGYSFKPWRSDKAIADGRSILQYVRETADENELAEKIRYGHRVQSASWSSDELVWTVEAETEGRRVVFTCRFLFMCSGYFNYAHGYEAEIPGLADFDGKVMHPQFWDDDYDYAGKNVVVIGSGATAVTIVPEMAKSAKHVTMLQRSPTYMVSAPDEDALSNKLKEWFAPKLAYGLTRWKNILFTIGFFSFCQKFPERAKALLLDGVRSALGSSGDVAADFTPRYDPWDQRMCLVPNGDFFNSIRDGSASVVTDRIDRVTPAGISLESGAVLDADMIVTATGLDVRLFGDVAISVDGVGVEPAERLAYKSLMLSDVPNFAFTMGYTNASWTLKGDLTCEFVTRLLNHMERHGYGQATPRVRDTSVGTEPLLNLTSGYVIRAEGKLPKQGDKAPWRLHHNYLLDILTIRYRSLDDDAMEFLRSPAESGEMVAAEG